MDENTEILMLVTNSIKNDINNPNQFISGTALCALGNIGNQEMCMALSREVQNQLMAENPLIRKKAALCAMRIIKKVDDIEDKFNSRLTSLLEDKNHGVIISACSLLVHLLETNPKEYLKDFKHCPQLLIKTLKNVLIAGYANAAEYDFSGIVDPFLQVGILKLIRLFAADSSILSSDELNDILAQIATNTDSSKNAGNAVLYECVQTIMAIQADSGLRVLGINILGKFLTNKDPNIKYVALSMLQKVVQVDPKAVQRHRQTVLECLKDTDLTIRKRALEVAYSLVSAENVKPLTKELISYLITADTEFKADLASRICMCIDKYSPDKRWHIDNTTKVLLLAGSQISDEVVYSLCHVVAGAETLHAYAAFKLFFALADPEQEQSDSLTIVATWILGEYGHLLVGGNGPVPISMSDLLDLFDEVIRGSLHSAADLAAVGKASASASTKSATVVCEYVVCAITKLLIKTNHTRTAALRSRVEATLHRFDGSLTVDLQQRVCEFKELLSDAWDDSCRIGLVNVMPPCEVSGASAIAGKPVGDACIAEAIPSNAQSVLEHVRAAAQNKGNVVFRKVRQTNQASKSQSAASKRAVGGFDLDDLLGEATVIQSEIPMAQQQQAAPKIAVTDDLLNDLFS